MSKKLLLILICSFLLFSACDLTSKYAQVVGMYVVGSMQIEVDLKPTNRVVAGKTYYATLYEKGTKRQTEPVSWTNPELNVLEIEYVYFDLTSDEFYAYIGEDISHIFSVKVSDSMG